VAQTVLDERAPRHLREAAHRGATAVAPAGGRDEREAGERDESMTHAENLIDEDESDRHGAHRLERTGRVIVEIVERVGDEHANARRAARPAYPEVQDFDGDPGIGGRRELDALESTTVAELCADAEPARGVVGAEGEQVARAEGERALRHRVMGELAGVQEGVAERGRETRSEWIRGHGEVESREAGARHVLELDLQDR